MNSPGVRTSKVITPDSAVFWENAVASKLVADDDDEQLDKNNAAITKEMIKIIFFIMFPLS